MRLTDGAEELKLALHTVYESPFPIPFKSFVKNHRRLASVCLVVGAASYGLGIYLDHQTLENISFMYFSAGLGILTIPPTVKFISSRRYKKNVNS